MATRNKIEMKKLPKENSNKVEKLIQGITNRYRVTAREARDIVTAVGTVGRAAYNSIGDKTNPLNTTATSKKNLAGSVKNLAKQVKEVGVASATGKKGTTSAQSGGRARGPKYTTNSGGTFQERELKPGKSRELTRAVGKKSGMTLAQKAALKKMLSQGGRLDK
jgi:uncharacterized protein YoxC